MAVIVALVVVVFAAGVAAGVVALVSAGIRREERDFSLTRRAPDRVSQGTRILTGLHVRQPGETQPSLERRPGMYV